MDLSPRTGRHRRARDRPRHTITARVGARTFTDYEPTFDLAITGIPRTSFRIDLTATSTGDGLGFVRRIENALDRLPTLATELRTEIDNAHQTLTQAEEAAARPFKHATALDTARGLLTDIETRLTPPDPAPPPESRPVPPNGEEPLSSRAKRVLRDRPQPASPRRKQSPPSQDHTPVPGPVL